MNNLHQAGAISVIVPTIGRPASLRRMLDSLGRQTHPVHEVIVADGSSTDETTVVVDDPCWHQIGLNVKRVVVYPPNAVRQRQAAIAVASGEFLLLLDDDVVLEPTCVEAMATLISSQLSIVAVFADFNNQSWPVPTRFWRCYLRFVHGMRDGDWNGKVIGPLLRFGYNPPPSEPKPMEWLATCNTMIRHDAYLVAGGFSDFFLHRCTMAEDVDLGLKMARHGRILFCPQARMGHFHAPGGRVSVLAANEDDLYNRFYILHQTMRKGWMRSYGLVSLYFAVETMSNFIGCVKRLNFRGFFPRLVGRLRALLRIAWSPRLT